VSKKIGAAPLVSCVNLDIKGFKKLIDLLIPRWYGGIIFLHLMVKTNLVRQK
jgi:hypothetical protein